jgi:hypothetical protein
MANKSLLSRIQPFFPSQARSSEAFRDQFSKIKNIPSWPPPSNVRSSNSPLRLRTRRIWQGDW